MPLGQGIPPPVWLADWLEPGRKLNGNAIGQCDVNPVFVALVEGAANVDRVNAIAIEDRLFGLGKLLHHIIDPCMPTLHVQMQLEL